MKPFSCRRKQNPDFGADSRNARYIGTKSCASTGISRELIERIAYGTDIELL